MNRLLKSLSKKQRYIIQSLFIGAFILLDSLDVIKLPLIGSIGIILTIVILSISWVHFPNINFKNMFLSMLLPVNLVLGAVLSLYFFPNLGIVFKIIVVLVYTLLYYLVLLVDNVFLVLSDREEVFPLYRVANTWGQILVIIIAIPLFAGIFKLPANFLIQSILVSFFSFIFSIYQISALKFDSRAKNVKVGELILLSLLIVFMVVSTNIAISFIPTESFLRALFEALVLMIGLIYVSSHIKNELTKSLMIEYLIIFLFFFAILFFFRP